MAHVERLERRCAANAGKDATVVRQTLGGKSNGIPSAGNCLGAPLGFVVKNCHSSGKSRKVARFGDWRSRETEGASGCNSTIGETPKAVSRGDGCPSDEDSGLTKVAGC